MRLRPLLQVVFLGIAAAVAGCGRNVDPAIYARFERAQQVFDRAATPEDFLRAAAIYQEILDSGTISGSVLYNQGNAFMRAGERGRAIACYRQAKRYRPRDPYLDANLQSALPAARNVARRRPIIEIVMFWQDWISYPGKFQLAQALAFLTFVAGLAGLFLRVRLLNVTALGALVLTVIACLSAGYDWYRFEVLERGVVVRDEVTARKGDSESYAPAFTSPLSEGTEFLVIDRRGEWVLTRVPDIGEGWLPSEAVVIY